MLKVKFADYMVQEKDSEVIHRPFGSGDMLFLYFSVPMYLRTENEEGRTEKNACVLFAPNDMHFFTGAPSFVNSYVHFDAKDEEVIRHIPTGRVIYPDNFASLNETVKKIKGELISSDILSEALNEAYMRELLINFARFVSRPETDSRDASFYALRARLLTELDKNFTSDYMAKCVNMSRTGFYEHYTKLFGSSPKKDVLRMKMEKAATLLSDRSKTVADVASAVGFSSVEHFTRYYKAYFSHSPRTKHQ